LDVEELVVNCLPIVVGSVVLDLASIHGTFGLWRACLCTASHTMSLIDFGV
jgi:hypothetical protein